MMELNRVHTCKNWNKCLLAGHLKELNIYANRTYVSAVHVSTENISFCKRMCSLKTFHVYWENILGHICKTHVSTKCFH